MSDLESPPPRGMLQRMVRVATLDLSPLRRHRDFRLLFLGQGLSFLGGQVRTVALPYQIYALTRSPLAVGLIGILCVVGAIVAACALPALLRYDARSHPSAQAGWVESKL